MVKIVKAYSRHVKKLHNDSFSFLKRHTIAAIVIGVLFVIGLFIAAGKIYLYLNFLIGNDLVLKLEANTADLFLTRGQDANVTVTMQVIANPFCSIECASEFIDISRNATLQHEEFHMQSHLMRARQYEISNEEQGKGQNLYRLTVTCHNSQNFLCHTTEEPTTRHLLITAEHDLNEQDKVLKSALKEAVENNSYSFQRMHAQFLSLNETNNLMQGSLSLPSLALQTNFIQQRVLEIQKNFDRAADAWEKQDYSLLNQESLLLGGNLAGLYQRISEFNSSLAGNISGYNSLAGNISSAHEKFTVVASLSLNASDKTDAESLIGEFNELVKQFGLNTKLTGKKEIAHQILLLNPDQFLLKSYENETLFHVEETVAEVPPAIEIAALNIPLGNFELQEQEAQCCVFGECRSCCYGCTENYPVIFLHGHAFNRDVSADYSLNAFDDLQKKLEQEEGYLIAGEFSVYSKRRELGVLGLSGVPLMLRASYYFDVFRKEGDYIPVQTKSESIDAYALKLRDIIEEVKYETNQKKVILAAHSMGGLVARRYIQIFGNASVDRMILVAVPNQGVTGSVTGYCPWFGATLECRDLDTESLFMNKLKYEKTDSSVIYNIFGTGCSMDEGQGDGIVLEGNAFLDGAEKNYIIKGNCSGFNLLHNEILDIKKYPQFYDAVKDALLTKAD